MIIRILLSVLLANTISLPAHAAYKCKKSSGYVYQDKPCIAQAPPDSPSPKTSTSETTPNTSEETETAIRLRREKAYLAV